MLTNYLKIISAVFLLNFAAAAQHYEIKHDTINAYGWFGGDNRPTYGPRTVGVGQSVFIDTSIRVEQFSFYFRGPFDYPANPEGKGHSVTLMLNVRDSTGFILKTVQTVLPDTFSAGWVTWDSINTEVQSNTTLIFTTYLVGAYDSLQVYGSAGADLNKGYDGGQRFGKDGVSDADMENWTDWAVHRSWDSAFRLEGEIVSITQVEVSRGSVIEDYALDQNYPNPFNPTTVISWQSAVGSWQTLKVFDVLGREVATLVNEYKSAGTYQVTFNAEGLSTGIYFYQLKIGNEFIETKKLILMK